MVDNVYFFIERLLIHDLNRFGLCRNRFKGRFVNCLMPPVNRISDLIGIKLARDIKPRQKPLQDSNIIDPDFAVAAQVNDSIIRYHAQHVFVPKFRQNTLERGDVLHIDKLIHIDVGKQKIGMCLTA